MSITLDQVTKRYQGAPVVNDVTLEVRDGEFFVLLGPSGSGKSTLLRAIAGLTGIDRGRISLHGREVTHIAARERQVGFVFQNYALFRHMSVADNIEFALRVRRMKVAARRRRRRELLELVALEGMDERLPTQLSGGQQQRVAVARALAHEPKVLLLDEPFGALDAKIREELRRTIREVQRELGITTILVTHDQDEAFSLADRIGVMHLGRLLETGPPEQLYARPSSRFVATFLGAANLLLGMRNADGLWLAERRLRAAEGPSEIIQPHQVVLVVRPEDLDLALSRDAVTGDFIGRGIVEELAFGGSLERIRVRLASDITGHTASSATGGERQTVLDVVRSQYERTLLPLAPGRVVFVGARRLHVLTTPLSSFCALAASEAEAHALASAPLLRDLGSRMKTAVDTSVVGPSPEPVPGVAVIERGPGAARLASQLFIGGASEVLALSATTVLPDHVTISWAGDAVRTATLSVSASLLRHMSAEATLVAFPAAGDSDEAASARVKQLLDARAEARSRHGVDLRTELRSGELVTALALEILGRDRQLMIVGLPLDEVLETRLEALLSAPEAAPVLVVCRPPAAMLPVARPWDTPPWSVRELSA